MQGKGVALSVRSSHLDATRSHARTHIHFCLLTPHFLLHAQAAHRVIARLEEQLQLSQYQQQVQDTNMNNLLQGLEDR